MTATALNTRLCRSASAVALASLALWFSGCGGASHEEAESGPPRLMVSVPPHLSLVEKIAGPYFTVETIAEPGSDPHSFSPTPRQVMELSRARAYFTTGMNFETLLLEKLEEDHLKVRVVSLSGEPSPSGGHSHEEHNHDDHGHGDHDHHHGDAHSDTHVWLSPPLLKEQAGLITATLCEIDPDHAGEFRANLAELEAELDALHLELTETLLPLKGRTFYVFHGAFAYFADTYGMKQEAIEIARRGPEPKRLMEIIESAKREGVKFIFVQPQFDQTSAKKIAEAIGGAVVPIDPLEVDIITNLRAIASQLKEALPPA